MPASPLCSTEKSAPDPASSSDQTSSTGLISWERAVYQRKSKNGRDLGSTTTRTQRQCSKLAWLNRSQWTVAALSSTSTKANSSLSPRSSASIPRRTTSARHITVRGKPMTTCGQRSPMRPKATPVTRLSTSEKSTSPRAGSAHNYEEHSIRLLCSRSASAAGGDPCTRAGLP